MQVQRSNRFSLTVALLGLTMLFCSFLCSHNLCASQIRAQRVTPIITFPAGEIAGTPASDNVEPKPEQADEDPPEDQKELAEIGDQFAQLHLQDGSIIGGEIKTESIDVKTAYGMLNVPIARIVQIYPGLNSRPEFTEKMAKLVSDLGGPSATDRDAAQKELISMGVKIRSVLNDLAVEGNAEQKKRIAQIQAAFEEEIEVNEEELMEVDRSMTFGDTIVTPDFSIVGQIQQKQFQVATKFGDLRVNLGDIRLADRKINVKHADVRKSVSIPAMAFFQKKPQSTGIRITKGDKVSIRADGAVQWTNWNTSSTPEGLTNRSQWNGINSGKLAARIGTDNSRCVQIGSNGDFVAKSSGILYLGIAMRDSYANSGSYTWTGQYKAKIIVKPKGN